MKRTQQIFKWLTLIFFGIVIYTLTIGQITSLEFVDWHHQHLFYDIIIEGLPIVILSTLVWTLKKDRPKKTNVIIGILTAIIAACMLIASFFFMFAYGFGAWVNDEIIYENRLNPEITINHQKYDIGAFGYGGNRTVKLTPFLKIWNWVEEVDTLKIDINKWELVEKD